MDHSIFDIEFSYQDHYYVALVKSFHQQGEWMYSVDLESDNQESHLRITAKPATPNQSDWLFYCGDGQPAAEFYDLELLQEIGEAIEQYEIAHSEPEQLKEMHGYNGPNPPIAGV